MLRDMTLLSRDTRSATGVFRLDGFRKPFYFLAVRAPSGAFHVQRIFPKAPSDATAAVSQALNGDSDNPPKPSRGEIVRQQRFGLPRRAATSGNTVYAC